MPYLADKKVLGMTKLKRILLSNRNNMLVELTDFGARVLSIKVPSRGNQLIEVTLNDSRDADILNDSAFKGATCGRVANRIGNAQFKMGNELYKLSANEGSNILHGGKGGFSQCLWKLHYHKKTFQKDSAVFCLESAHLDQGFPGNIIATVTYTLGNDNTLRIEFSATSDRPTPINMCNHSYFTMGESDIDDLQLKVNASHYLQVNRQGIPTGQKQHIDNLVSLNTLSRVGDFLSHHPLDHCYVLDSDAAIAAQLSSQKQGLRLNIKTNQPGLQVYTGQHLKKAYGAIALEAQGLINAVNHAKFESDWARPEQAYSRFVSYQFESI